MGSRNTDGTRILKALNVRGVRHTGEKISITNSRTDSIVSRVSNTSHRPPAGNPTRD